MSQRLRLNAQVPLVPIVRVAAGVVAALLPFVAFAQVAILEALTASSSGRAGQGFDQGLDAGVIEVQRRLQKYNDTTKIKRKDKHFKQPSSKSGEGGGKGQTARAKKRLRGCTERSTASTTVDSETTVWRRCAGREYTLYFPTKDQRASSPRGARGVKETLLCD